jgi:hypothetical protein
MALPLRYLRPVSWPVSLAKVLWCATQRDLFAPALSTPIPAKMMRASPTQMKIESLAGDVAL